jgi:hypothetical protein
VECQNVREFEFEKKKKNSKKGKNGRYTQARPATFLLRLRGELEPSWAE